MACVFRDVQMQTCDKSMEYPVCVIKYLQHNLPQKKNIGWL